MSKRLLVLGAGTAGTMIVNKLRRRLDARDWDITVVDRDDTHHYQPGYLFLPFGTYSREQLTRSRHVFLPDGVDFVIGDVDRVDAPADTVALTDGRTLSYDYLVIASGTSPRPDQTPGMLGKEWRRSIFDFYTLEGATAPATSRLKKSIADVDVPEVPEFLEQIVASGGHLWACRMSADMNKLTEEDLYDEVEGIISASDFIEKTEGAQLLFI